MDGEKPKLRILPRRIAPLVNHFDCGLALRDLEDDLHVVSGRATIDLATQDPHAASRIREELAEAAGHLAAARVLLESW